MNGILIVAHAPLASALRACVLHVFADAVDSVRALDVQPHMPPEETLAQARVLARQFAEPSLLVLTDVFGATPCNVAQRLALAVDRASAEQPSLKTKRVSPHSLRHTTAMHLLQSGVPFNIIALWLGHESTNTTHRYVEANLEMKEKALARLEAPDVKLQRFRADDDLMKFLRSL